MPDRERNAEPLILDDNEDSAAPRAKTPPSYPPADLAPPPPAPPAEAVAAPSPATPAPPSAAGNDAGATRYRRRVVLVLSAVVLALILYWGAGYVVAYTDDAYVTSDLVAVAPQITGRIVAVPIVDNQTVKKGDLLAEIDPTPFQLSLNEKKAKLVEAQAQLAVDHDAIKAAKAARDHAAAAAKLAADNLARAGPVAASGFLSRQGLDEASAADREAKAALASAEDAVAKARQMEALHQATVTTIEAEIAYLQWQLDQTRLLAPVDGAITNLTLRVGDQAVANVPLVGLVDAHAWRVLANYKESVIRHMKVGRRAWVWLDFYPWHIHRARIQGIARGINRNQGPNMLLPYVAPTTDWIRLERRFPVTLDFEDLNSEIVLRMGGDARAIIFY
jgi:multidrug efflux system membrane fusion protein